MMFIKVVSIFRPLRKTNGRSDVINIHFLVVFFFPKERVNPKIALLNQEVCTLKDTDE